MPRKYHGYWGPHECDTYIAMPWGEPEADGIPWKEVRRNDVTMSLACTNNPAHAVVGRVVFVDLGAADVICGSPAAMRLRSGDGRSTGMSRVRGPHFFVVTGFFAASGQRIPEGPRDQCFVQLVALTSTVTDHGLSESEKVPLPRGPASPAGVQFLEGDSYVHVLRETAQVLHVPAAMLAFSWVAGVQVTLPAVRTINTAVAEALPTDDEREHHYAAYARRNPPPAAPRRRQRRCERAHRG